MSVLEGGEHFQIDMTENTRVDRLFVSKFNPNEIFRFAGWQVIEREATNSRRADAAPQVKSHR
jgi:hypothetical protein